MPTPDTFSELLREELTPEPDPRFAAEMDEWVASGFPRRPSPQRRGTWLGRATLAVRTPLGLATASTAVAGLLIAALLIGESAQQSTTRTPQSEPGSAPNAVGTGAGDAAQPALPFERQAVPPAAGSIAPAERNRRIERSSQMTLAAPADDFQPVGDRILRITDSHDGFVLRSNVSTGDHPSGDFQLRVPGGELQPTLRDLAALGDVKARSDTGQDVTREYVSVADQLAAA